MGIICEAGRQPDWRVEFAWETRERGLLHMKVLMCSGITVPDKLFRGELKKSKGGVWESTEGPYETEDDLDKRYGLRDCCQKSRISRQRGLSIRAGLYTSAFLSWTSGVMTVPPPMKASY